MRWKNALTYRTLFGHFCRVKWLNLGGGHLMTRQGYDIAQLTLSARFTIVTRILSLSQAGSAIAGQQDFAEYRARSYSNL